MVDVVYGHLSDPVDRARAAGIDGFAHIDVGTQDVVALEASAVLPVGCPTAFPKPVAGFCSTPAPPAGDGAWERTVRWFRAAPGALLEPWGGAVVHSLETMLAVQDEVPGLRFLVDTGHVAAWGGDPVELLHLAGHVQIRQGAPGRTQLHCDDPDGVVDFAAVSARLDALDYDGRISVEYFDLPEWGWPLDDPRAWAVDLATRLRSSW